MKIPVPEKILCGFQLSMKIKIKIKHISNAPCMEIRRSDEREDHKTHSTRIKRVLVSSQLNDLVVRLLVIVLGVK